MDFSLFYILHRPDGMSDTQVYEEAIEQAIAADELGFKCIWFAEHHFSRVGMVPDPLLMCAAVAQKTERIRLGTAISVIPFHNPVQLAGQAAMVDVLSGGRLDLGVGRGSQPKEFLGFRARPSESRARLKEGVEILDRLLSGERLTFKGQFYECQDVEIHPKPVQKPRPPIWIAGTSLETYTYAGERGFHVMASAAFKGPEVYREKIELWEKAIRGAGGDPSKYPRALLHHLHVCRNEEEKEEVLGRIEEGEGWYLRYRSEVNQVELPREEDQHLKRNLSYQLDIRGMTDGKGGGVIGTADQVIESVRELRDEFGVTDVLVGPWRGPSSREVIRSLELFAKEVMPALQN
ncbi:MAG TPA: hypothetical protein DDZ83_10760 [Nitrospinae bacterium]|nr:hypothetical protein [Nitrospinota bacterium]